MHWPGSETEPFNRFRLERLLTTRVFGRQLVTLPRTTSTNDLAKELALQGAPEGTVIVADEQTAGRGRMERRWLAPPGTCLLCSILFRPALSLPQVNWLTMLCSMAAADAVEKTSALQVTLKWPNDLIIQSSISPPTSSNWSKLAGVLTETGITGQRLDFAVVGMGINVNVERDVLP
ncbi:MAG: biotin--[acetyl-CoA-carboxylase] ligase, partial [Chloroflexi bacterium]